MRRALMGSMPNICDRWCTADGEGASPVFGFQFRPGAAATYVVRRHKEDAVQDVLVTDRTQLIAR